MNLFMLLQRASIRLETSEAEFHNQAELITGILRSAGVLAHRRSSLNGKLHKLVAAVLVEAYEHCETIDVTIRRAGSFALYNYSTKIISYLDKAVAAGLLISQTSKAKGKLDLSDLLVSYLDNETFVPA